MDDGSRLRPVGERKERVDKKEEQAHAKHEARPAHGQKRMVEVAKQIGQAVPPAGLPRGGRV